MFCSYSLPYTEGSHVHVWDETLHLSLSDFFLLVLVHKDGTFPFSLTLLPWEADGMMPSSECSLV